MEQRVTQVEIRQNNVDVKVGVIENQVQELKAVQKETSQEVAENKQELRVIQNEYGHIAESCSRIERVVISNNETHAKQIDSLKTDMSDQKVSIGRIMGAFLVVTFLIQVFLPFVMTANQMTANQ